MRGEEKTPHNNAGEKQEQTTAATSTHMINQKHTHNTKQKDMFSLCVSRFACFCLCLFVWLVCLLLFARLFYVFDVCVCGLFGMITAKQIHTTKIQQQQKHDQPKTKKNKSVSLLCVLGLFVFCLFVCLFCFCFACFRLFGGGVFGCVACLR